MKELKRKFTLRTALLTALTVTLITSAAVFIAVSAAESVTPSDVSPTSATADHTPRQNPAVPQNVSSSDVSPSDLPDEDAEEAREGLVEEKGFFILPSELFVNVRRRASKDENLNETLETIFNHIEDSAKGTVSEDDFAGLFDDFDVNSNKLGATVAKRNEKLVKLLDGIGDMNLGDYKDNTIDAFGDAYEYLMTMYASNAGKSGGEFYTPQEVSRLLALLGLTGKTEVNKVYDPACGSGSLLLQAAKILGKDHVRQGFF